MENVVSYGRWLSMAKVVLFGLRDIASLAHFYLTHDSDHDVVAFCVHRKFLPAALEYEGKPIVALEEVVDRYPPRSFHFFAPMSERGMNRLRADVYSQIKHKGYRFISYISSRATVFPQARIGDNCFILEDNTIQPFTPIGDNVVMWSGNHIGHHGIVKDHVFFTSHVVMSGHCTVEPYCFFGVNATVRDGLHIAKGTLVAMTTSIVKDTEPWGVYKGIPGKKSKISSKDLKF